MGFRRAGPAERYPAKSQCMALALVISGSARKSDEIKQKKNKSSLDQCSATLLKVSTENEY